MATGVAVSDLGINVNTTRDMAESQAVRRSFVIRNEKGLHARAATRLVQTASRFDAEVTIEKDGQSVNGKSVMSLLILAATRGSTIIVEARGNERDEAMSAVAELIDRKFDED